MEQSKVYTVDTVARLDQFLFFQGDLKSRSEAKKLIEAGAVRVNGKTVKKPSTVLAIGQEVAVVLPSPAEIPVLAKGSVLLSIDVLYEDDECMVISKPRDVVVHPAGGHKGVTLLDGLHPMFAERKLPFSPEAVLVHRLDRETTGCLIIAKNPKAHMILQKQFADRSIEKTYLALVYGVPEHPEAMIDAPIGRHAQQRTKMSVMRTVRGRNAQTTYRTLGSADGTTLLSCDLHTGRTHQLRVHLSSIGHPILGDDSYNTQPSVDLAEELRIDFLCLHAWKLAFDSPAEKRVATECPVPDEFKKLLSRLGIARSIVR